MAIETDQPGRNDQLSHDQLTPGQLTQDQLTPGQLTPGQLTRGIDWLPPKLVNRMSGRRGRLNTFERLVPSRTALVVIDLVLLHAEDAHQALRVVEHVNQLAAQLRLGGGVVAWVRPRAVSPTALTSAVLGHEPAARYATAAKVDNPRAALHPKLRVDQNDLRFFKQGYSAFFPGACDLPETLGDRDIDTVLIAGAVTNVCCEASARDAYMRGFKVVMLADACLAKLDEHRAALAAIYRNYGDVRTTEEAITLLKMA